MPLRLVIALSLLHVVWGCEGAVERPTSALFSLPGAGPSRLFALPFPNDILQREDGTLELLHLGAGQTPLVQRYLDVVADNSLGGYATNGGAFFRFDGELDSATLPPTPRASLDPSSSVRWVNIDARSRDYGKVMPVRCRFRAQGDRYIGDNSLAVLPEPGFVLDPATTYAVILFEGIRDRRGYSVAPSPDFLRLLDDDAAAMEITRSHQTYAPLRRYVNERGLTGLVSAAVFTTGRPTAIAERFAEVIAMRPSPRLESLAVVAHREGVYELEGRFVAPAFQQGEPPYTRPEDGGLIALTVDGRPIVAREVSLRFALTVPEGPPPAAGWPVVFYAHGTGGDYRSFVRSGIADDFARVGGVRGAASPRLAMISIDQVSHGDRGNGASPDLAFFNITHPEAAVHNVLQGAADGHVISRFLGALELGEILWRKTSARAGQRVNFAGARFDMRRFGFLGHSQGALTGAPFIPYAKRLGAAVLSGGGAVAMLSLLQKSEPADIRLVVETLLAEPVDRFHPMLTLLQQLLEPADPANYARAMLGRNGSHLLLTQGIEDHYTPVETIDALAVAASLPILGEIRHPILGLELRGVEPAPLPAVANWRGGRWGWTAGILQELGASLDASCALDDDCGSSGYCHDGQCRRDGHFVLFHRPELRQRVVRFFSTFARDGIPRVE